MLARYESDRLLSWFFNPVSPSGVTGSQSENEWRVRAAQAAKDAFGRVGLRWVYKFAVDTGAFNRPATIPIHAVYETAAYDVLSYISLTNGMAQ